MRLIDADRLKEVFRRNTGHDYSELIDIQPTVDVLDKIRAEIMQLYNEVEVVDYDHNDTSRIKKAHWITREEVLWIIDKYR